jgi:hypothetical protein
LEGLRDAHQKKDHRDYQSSGIARICAGYSYHAKDLFREERVPVPGKW